MAYLRSLSMISPLSLNFYGIMVLGLSVILSLIGLLGLYSAANGQFDIWAEKQGIMVLILFFIVIAFSFININVFYCYAYHIYAVTLVLLVVAEILGYTAMGAQRWLRFGFVNIQPSELMKIGLILALARYFHATKFTEIKTWKGIIFPIFLTLVPVALVLKQPNLGTATILLLVSGAIFFIAGVKIYKFALVLGGVIITGPICWNFLHDYQKQRIMTFLNPESDHLGAGYNIIQSQVAVGAGGIYGQGLLQGSQNQLDFLPEKHTDFIFTLLAEECGFIGVVLILALYMLLISMCWLISRNSNALASRIIAAGIASLLFVHIFINIGMISGILPVVGTPLPFLSYGRSNLMTCWFGIGLVLSVNASRKQRDPQNF